MFAHMKSLHISLKTAACKSANSTFDHVIIYTFFSSLPIPPPTSRFCHLHLSTGRYPIIHNPTLTMPKPPQSATPHLTTSAMHTLYTQKTVQIHTALVRFLSFNDTPHIHLTIIRSVLSRLCRFSAFIGPCFSPIYQHTLNNHSLRPSPGCQDADSQHSSVHVSVQYIDTL